MRPLSRRALFALPVALPVAAVVAKVAPLPAPAMLIGVDAGGRDRSVVWMATGMRRGKSHVLKAMHEAGFLTIDDVRRANRLLPINTQFEIPPREGAADAAKPVTAQAAAPVGEKSCGAGCDPGGCENIGDRLCTGRQPSPPPLYDRDGVRPANGVAPGPHDTPAQPVAA